MTDIWPGNSTEQGQFFRQIRSRAGRDCLLRSAPPAERDCLFGEPGTIEQDSSSGGLKITAD